MRGALTERVFRVVQEHQVGLPPEVLGCLFHRRAQSYGLQAVRPAVRPREVSDLRGDRELRQQITGRPRQDPMRAEAEVVGAGVERGDTEIKRSGQETALVTRPV